MNSQRGKASTNASRQNKSQQSRQSTKSQTNGRNESFIKGIMAGLAKSGPMMFPSQLKQKKRNAASIRNTRDLSNKQGSRGILGLSSSNFSRATKSHLIDEDEYIADINGSVGFQTTSYSINPGQSGTFPWGYKIAGLYEKYKFLFLEFYYRREVSEFATNGQSGKVMLSVDFDASDGPPTTKQQVLDTAPHVDGMPCVEKLSLVVDPSQMANQDSKYVRPGAQPANTDIKTYDAGNFFISTYGNTNTSVIGELRVRYKVLVSVPVLESGIPQYGAAGSYFSITSNLSGETAAATTVDTALFVSTTTPVVIANGIGATIASSGLITVPAGIYLVSGSNCASNSAVNVTACALSINFSATASTGILFGSNACGTQGVSATANVSSGFKSFSSFVSPVVWNTAIMGTVLSLHAADTYASGTCLNNGYMKIELL